MCTGTSDIKKSPLLLQVFPRIYVLRTWEQIFLQTYDKNILKLQAFCSMNSHQLNFVSIFIITFIRISQQSHILHKHVKSYELGIINFSQIVNSSQGIALLREVTDSINQFFNIVHSAYAFRGLVLIDIPDDTRNGGNFLGHLLRTLLAKLMTEIFNHYHKLFNLGDGSGRNSQFKQFLIVGKDIPDRHFQLGSGILDFLHSCLAYLTGRIIDYPVQCLFIKMIDCQAEISQQVFDFLTLVK